MKVSTGLVSYEASPWLADGRLTSVSSPGLRVSLSSSPLLIRTPVSLG